MRNSSGFQGENMSGGEESKVNGSTDISSIKRVTRKLKEVSLFSRAKQRQGNVQKVCCTCKGFFFFVLIRKKCVARAKLFFLLISACLRGGGGPQVDEVTRLGGVKK